MSKLSRLLKCQRRSLISRIRLAFRISAVPPCFIFCCSCLAAFFCRFCAVCLGFCPALLCTFRLSSDSAIFPCIYRACPSIQNGFACCFFRYGLRFPCLLLPLSLPVPMPVSSVPCRPPFRSLPYASSSLSFYVLSFSSILSCL